MSANKPGDGTPINTLAKSSGAPGDSCKTSRACSLRAKKRASSLSPPLGAISGRRRTLPASVRPLSMRSTKAKRCSPWQIRCNLPSGACMWRTISATVPMSCRSPRRGSSTFSSFCSTSASGCLARTASITVSMDLPRVTTTGSTTPGNSTMLRTGTKGNTSSRSSRALGGVVAIVGGRIGGAEGSPACTAGAVGFLARRFIAYENGAHKASRPSALLARRHEPTDPRTECAPAPSQSPCRDVRPRPAATRWPCSPAHPNAKLQATLQLAHEGGLGHR